MEDFQEPPDGVQIKPKSVLADLIKSEAAVRGTDLIAGAVAIGVIFWWLQFSTNAICCGDFDGYYHIKWAQMLWQNLRAKHFSPSSFIWLPLTTLNPHDYVDHHLLFHILLITGVYLLFERKFWPLLPLAFVFALTYDMFVLLILAAGVWTIVIGWTEQRFEWRPLAWVMLGSVLGLVINPYFPHNLYLFYEHARVKITPNDFATKVGNEWYPYDTREFVANCYVALAAMLAGYLFLDIEDRERAERPLFFLLLSTSLLLMTARWKRFAEYFPPFAILFAAFTLENFWRGRAIFTRLPDSVMEDLRPFLARQPPSAPAQEFTQHE